MKKLLILILALLLLLTGCSDSREVDNMAYILAIGVDKGAENLKYTLQIAVPLNISGGIDSEGKAEPGKSPLDNITVEADSLYSAIDLVNNHVSKQLNVSHCKLLVISEQLATEGLDQKTHTLLKGKDFRPHSFVAVARGGAENYLKNISSALELNPARYYELMFKKDYSAFTPTVYLKDFLTDTEVSETEAVAPLAFVTEGDEPVSQISGMAIFKENKMVGTADANETFLYKILSGTFTRAHNTISPPQGETILEISAKETPKIYVDTNGEAPVIKVKLFLSGEIVSSRAAESPTASQIAEVLNGKLSDFLYKTSQIHNSDIFSFGKYAKCNFLTTPEWEEYNWKEKYPLSRFEVETDFKLVNTGKIKA